MAVSKYAKGAIGKAKKFLKAKLKAIMLPVIGVVVLVAVIIALISAIVSAISGSDSGSSSSGLYGSSSSSWQQFLRYMISKEGGTRVNEAGNKDENGAYYLVEDDSAGNPTVGHGLCLKSGDGYLHVGEFSEHDITTSVLVEKYEAAVEAGYNSKKEADMKYFPKVSVEICDAIWEAHVKAKYDSIVSSYPDLTTYQQYALTDVLYRRGNTNHFKNKYSSKWSASDNQFGNYVEANEPFSTDTLYDFFWDNWGSETGGVPIRKKDQWVLFKYGYYRPLNEYFIESSGGDILEVAQELHDAQKTWTYSTSDLTGGDIEKAINNPSKKTCCATYVSSVVYKAGYVTESEINNINYNNVNPLYNLLESKGWEKITNVNDLQPGDLIFFKGVIDPFKHVQICADLKKSLWYNARFNWRDSRRCTSKLDLFYNCS